MIAETLSASSIDLPQYARRDNSGCYTWQGVKHPSVTTILEMISGSHLGIWHAKMAAEECASILQRSIEGIVPKDDAEAQILDWKSRMTAAIRYRDHKARIGSLTHHALYERSLGVAIPSDMVEYLRHHAYDLALVDKATEDELDPYSVSLCKEARHYVASGFAWMDEELPEFEAIGQEAVIVSETHGYAGTTDFIARFPKRGNRRFNGDFKTSNVLDEKKVRMQVEAYRRADFIGLVATGQTFDLPETDGIMAVWIRPVDPAVTKLWDPSVEVYEAFLSLRHAYGVLNDMPKPNACKRSDTPKKARGACPF